ncbi:siderophore-interacting protein [Burkholderia gladioli]|uniref:siderophore-interacting protein n=1 Tax=Burkholderia gladioli TaxID=28095 RepID=UPI00163FB240|nr:siderophore-interacting protein [Burkholderia gladioli]
MELKPPRLLRLKTCGRREQQFLTLLRGLAAGPGWRSQAIHELDGFGISAEASFPLLRLMETIRRVAPDFQVLSPHAPLVSVDELNLMTVLRRAALRAMPEHRGDLGFSMPLALSDLVALCGDVLRHSHVRLGRRPLLAATNELGAKMETEDMQQITDARTMRPTTVVSNEELTHGIRRIRLAGPALAGLSDDPPAKWVKVFPKFGEPSTERVTNINPVGRVYSIRHFDSGASVLTIDVAIHGPGAVSSWLERCKPGDECEVAGSRGGFEGIPRNVDCAVFVGDETSLPAIESILEDLPDHIGARAYIETADERTMHEPLRRAESIKWIRRRSTAETLANEVAALCSHNRNVFVWAAGEASRMRLLRRTLVSQLGLEAARVHTVGYWKEGATDHRDAAAG